MTNLAMKKEIWWNSKGITWDQAFEMDNFDLKMQKFVKTQFPNHFFDHETRNGDGKQFVRNYNEVRTHFIELFDKKSLECKEMNKNSLEILQSKSEYKSLNIPYRKIESLIGYPFFDCLLIGGDGDLDDGMIEMTGKEQFEQGWLLYNNYHSGDALFDNINDQDPLLNAIADYFYCKMHSICNQIGQLLNNVIYFDTKFQSHIVIETEMLSEVEVIWRRYLVPKGENSIKFYIEDIEGTKL